MANVRELVGAAHAAGWTDRALAERLGVSVQTVLRWRLGHGEPDSPTILALALESVLAREAAPPRRRPGRRTKAELAASSAGEQAP